MARFIFPCLLLAVSLSLIDSRPDARIIYGWMAKSGQFPWMAAIYVHTESKTSFCGGTVITDQAILTSAHCVLGAVNFTIYLGSTSLVDYDYHRVIIETENYVMHPDFIPSSLLHDVAIIKTKNPLNFTEYIQPIPLSKTYAAEEVKTTIAGWGKMLDSTSTVTEDLRYAETKTVTDRECAEVYGDAITYRIGCLDATQQGPCAGDFGGPVVAFDDDNNPYNIGILSFVTSVKCETGHPTGYTRTSAYWQWISEVTGN